MTSHGHSFQRGTSSTRRPGCPRGARHRPSIPPYDVLSATLCSSLRLPFGLPSLPPLGDRLRFGVLSIPNWKKVALLVTRGQWTFAKSRRSPHLSRGRPQYRAPPSPTHPQSDFIPSERELGPPEPGRGGSDDPDHRARPFAPDHSRPTAMRHVPARRTRSSDRGHVRTRDPAVDEKGCRSDK